MALPGHIHLLFVCEQQMIWRDFAQQVWVATISHLLNLGNKLHILLVALPKNVLKIIISLLFKPAHEILVLIAYMSHGM